jgi:Ion channel
VIYLGYGNIAPKTQAGMVVTMLYAIAGIPLTLLAITNLGRMLATVFRFIYKNVCCVIFGLMSNSRQSKATLAQQQETATSSHQTTPHKSANGNYSETMNLESNKMPCEVYEEAAEAVHTDAAASRWRPRLPIVEFVTDMDEIQKVSVPISVSLALIVGYVALGSLLFGLCEGWDYLVASYFCFITLSTIGFGDYVPGTSLDAAASQEKMVLCALYLVFGLAMLAMCFDLMQEEARNKFDSLGRRLGLIDDKDDDD